MSKLSEHRNCGKCERSEVEIGGKVYSQSEDSNLCQECLDRDNQEKIEAYSATNPSPSNHLCNAKIVCPHCGYENEPDCEDYDLDNDQRECGNCESVFSCTTNIEVTYTTSKIEDD
ncbi:TPA: hypothetical protein I7730_00615 [Vibrio vulnificus]|uniref:Uncharacterized protein n=1 Tax=Vibrio vulnificus TaxID=672 RepID=A0A8H9K5F7_VIBVL|nr:hypothetical protein [Vibrio vulnificus]HAS8538301.1 hypothetical protein [Vibrio vulnificus]